MSASETIKQSSLQRVLSVFHFLWAQKVFGEWVFYLCQILLISLGIASAVLALLFFHAFWGPFDTSCVHGVLLYLLLDILNKILFAYHEIKKKGTKKMNLRQIKVRINPFQLSLSLNDRKSLCKLYCNFQFFIAIIEFLRIFSINFICFLCCLLHPVNIVTLVTLWEIYLCGLWV